MMFPNPNSSNTAIPGILFCAVILVAIQAVFPLPQGFIKYGDHVENTTITDANENLELPLSSKKETEQISPLHNDSLVCFPYFLSQEIDSLLNQALKMLSKSKNERQKSWLRFFVHRLESLSTQLRKLPTEHKNRCYHSRERMVADENKNNLLLAPEELQLRFARKLFLAARPRLSAVRPDNRPKEYATGVISAERNQIPPQQKNVHTAKSDAKTRKSSQSEIALNAHQSNKNIEKNLDNSEISENLDLDTILRSSTTLEHQNSKDYSVPRPVGPITHWESKNFDYEKMPFLPRSTRKSIPHPIEERMKFRALSSHKNPRIMTTTLKDQTETEVPTVLPTFQKERKKDNEHDAQKESITTNSLLSWNNHQENYQRYSTQQYEESSAQIHDQEFSLPSLTDRGYKTANFVLSTPKPVQKIEDDDLVIQLHSGGMNTNMRDQHMHPGLLMSNKVVNSWPQATPLEVASKPPTTEKIPSNDELVSTHEPSLHSLLAKSSAATKADMAQNNDLTNLDFDYEEQGAAAGELFLDNEFLPTKSIAIPSSVASIQNTGSGEDDDVVKQLDELKSLKSSETLSNDKAPSTASRHTVPTSKDDVQVGNVPHLVDFK